MHAQKENGRKGRLKYYVIGILFTLLCTGSAKTAAPCKMYERRPEYSYISQEDALRNAIQTLSCILSHTPRSYNPQKGEPYACGIPARGKAWMQFKVGYYLFAILFLMFDIETVFLFPWAVRVGDMGV